MEGHGRGTKVLQRMTYLHVPTQCTRRVLSRRFGLNIALWSPGLNCGPIDSQLGATLRFEDKMPALLQSMQG